MIIDVTEADFQREVLDRSQQVPVVVDFWATWCGPCRQLTPVLEQATKTRAGQVVLAKVDTDRSPRVSQSFRVQGIPAVKAFRDGRVVDEFVGAKPPAEVERFFDRLVPSEADALVAAGDEASLRRALELEPGRRDAAVALARILHGQGDPDAAFTLVEPLEGSFAAEGLTARIRLERSGDPALAQVFALLDTDDREAGLDALLGALQATQDGQRDDLRRAIVGVLDDLGVDHPTAREYRRRLAAALY